MRIEPSNPLFRSQFIHLCSDVILLSFLLKNLIFFCFSYIYHIKQCLDLLLVCLCIMSNRAVRVQRGIYLTAVSVMPFKFKVLTLDKKKKS